MSLCVYISDYLCIQFRVDRVQHVKTMTGCMQQTVSSLFENVTYSIRSCSFYDTNFSPFANLDINWDKLSGPHHNGPNQTNVFPKKNPTFY